MKRGNQSSEVVKIKQEDGAFQGFHGKKFKRTDTRGQLEQIPGREATYTTGLQYDEGRSTNPVSHALDVKKYLQKRRGVTYFWRQILFYDHEKMIRWKSLTFFWGTILEDMTLWTKVGTMLLITIGSAVLCHLIYGADAAELDTNYMDTIITQLNALTAFLLGFYLNEVVKRWWKVRDDCIGELWRAINNLCQLTATHLGEDTEDQQCKALVLRYGLLSHALCYKQAQKTDSQLQDMLEIELINKDELVILKNLRNKPQVIWVWMTSFFRYLIWDTRQIPQELVKNVHDELFRGRGAIQRTFSYIDTQVPLPYTHLNALTVHCFHLALAVICGINCTVAIHESNWGRFCLQVAMIGSFGPLYQGILIISAKLQNPLGDDDIDFPRMAYHMALQETGEAFFLAAQQNKHLSSTIG